MNTNKRPIAVDLFAGAGGMSLGFEQAGFDILASVEIDPIHCATHKFNFPYSKVFCADITKITGEEIRNNSLIKNQDIDVVCGGSPCQGFSLIGKRNINDDRNDLVFQYFRLVKELQPKYFVFENVKGITNGIYKDFLKVIFQEIKNFNYKVQENYEILNASKYGVPQNRERLFLLGCRQDFDLPDYPIPTTVAKKFYKPRVHVNLTTTPTVFDAIADLPEIENYPELLYQDWVKAEFGTKSNYVLNLNNNFSYTRNYDTTLLTSSMRTVHGIKSISRFRNTKPGRNEPISHFYRLKLDGLCNTLKAGTPTNKGAFTAARPIHPIYPRCITVREGARLHSYPDWFRFHTTKAHGFRQVGNSVPPLLAHAIATQIIKSLGIQITKPSIIFDLTDISLLTLDPTSAAKYFDVNAHVIEPRTKKY